MRIIFRREKQQIEEEVEEEKNGTKQIHTVT